jgi:hypothetical protein
VIHQGHNAPLVQPDPAVALDHQPKVFSLGRVFAGGVNFILLPASGRFGLDAEKPLRFNDGQNCQQEIRYVTGNDGNVICLSRKNIRKRNVSLQPPLDTHNYTRFVIYHWSRLSKLVDRIDLLQLNQMIDVLRKDFALVALHTDDASEGNTGASLEKTMEGSGVLSWVRFFCTAQAANSVHEFREEDLPTVHARQQFMVKAATEDIDKHEERFFLQMDEPNHALRSGVNRGSHTMR